MPNWTENRIYFKTASDKEAEALIARFKHPSEPDAELTFNAFIPRPAELMIDDGSELAQGYDFLKKHPDGKPNPGEKIPSERALQLGRQAIDNEARFGAKTWYDWSIDNWGTKWDAGDVDIDRSNNKEGCFCVVFNTAWCAPFGVARAMKELFGDALVAWYCHDEGDYDLPVGFAELSKDFDVSDMAYPRWYQLA